MLHFELETAPEFIFIFLPLTVVVYNYLLRSWGGSSTIFFMLLVSLVFYGYNCIYGLPILCFATVLNFYCGKNLATVNRFRHVTFAIVVTFNVCLLGYFKYVNFFLETLYAVSGKAFQLQSIAVPLGISFFVFQQIAYLSDMYKKTFNQVGVSFIDYCCFSFFMPNIVSGPIVHCSEIVPQFFCKFDDNQKFKNYYFAIIIFSIGLAKKVIVADSLSPIVHLCFDDLGTLTFMEAVFGSLAYTLQLYFDFSGYSDMALAVALLFNVQLPWNFNSPYLATDIQAFWRRWHITLSVWLRDHLYIPLGGNRRGSVRALVNIVVTFLIGGLWHGAAWTFVVWGAMHGMALAVHRVWKLVVPFRLPAYCGWLLTFGFVNAAWIVFRAPDMNRVGVFLKALSGRAGFFFSIEFRGMVISRTIFYDFTTACIFLAGALSLVFLKNTQGLAQYYLNRYFRIMIGLMFIGSIYFMLRPNSASQFLYFQF